MNKIAFVSTNKSSWGGSEYLWYYTALKLFESGKSIVTGVPRWKNIPGEIGKIRSKGIVVKYYTDTSNYKKLANRFLPSSLQFDLRDDGYKFLFDFKPELTVINQGGNTGGIDLMEFCIKNNFNFVTITQAANEAKWPSDELNRRMSAALSQSAMNYFVCQANIHLTQIQLGQVIPNTRVIFNPFNVRYDNELIFPDTRENFILANVARHEIYAKGQDIMFEVLNEKKWRERNLIVELYGKGEHTYSIQKLKNYFNLDKVYLAGHVEPEEIWKRSHALILTSRYEGLPLALVEAMLCGRFGIVTNVSGNPELIIDNENGFLAKAPKAEFVDEAMEKAWSRRSDWEFIGRKAKEHCRTVIPGDPINFFCNELLNLKI